MHVIIKEYYADDNFSNINSAGKILPASLKTIRSDEWAQSLQLCPYLLFRSWGIIQRWLVSSSKLLMMRRLLDDTLAYST